MTEDRSGQASGQSRRTDQDRPRDDLLERITVSEAAEQLGITQDAVRKRIARGTLRHVRDHDGRIYVYPDISEKVSKTVQDDTQDQPSRAVQDAGQDRYVAALEDQIQFLRRELERKDAILLRLTERIPELEAPTLEPASGPRDVPETDSEDIDRSDDVGDGARESPRPCSWWRRFFGFE